MRVLLLFISVSYISSGGASLPDARIIGGTAANAGQFGYFAAITAQTTSGSYFCGGSLIHHQFVLTSAYCVYKGGLFTIQLGSLTLTGDDPNRVTLATSIYHQHPDFNADSIENDIAIIQLREPISSSMYIELVSLPLQDITHPTSLETVGHGQTSDAESGLSEELRYAIVTSISNEECRIYYGGQVNDNMLCAIGNYNQGTCTGDTGGPLILSSGKLYQVVAVSSFISANGCESIYPSGYTRVYPYLDWINSVINSVVL